MSDTAAAAEASDQRLELIRRRLAERGIAPADAGAIDTAGAVSDGQRRMWFAQELDSTGVLLNVCVSHRLTGVLDADRLHAAVDTVADRHPVLRTTYAADGGGEPRATVHDDLYPAWSAHDVSDLSPRARSLRLEVLAQREFGTPFDLSAEPPLRITLVKTGSDEHVMLFVAHHVAWDDASWQVFFADLTRAYDGESLPPAPQVPTPVEDSDEDLAFWRSALAHPPEPLELPGPNGSALPSDFRSERCVLGLPADTVDAVATLARDTGSSPYMVMLAAFGALIYRCTHTEDFLVAAPVLNRKADPVIGYYGNTVVLRVRPRGRQSFRDLVAETRDSAVGAFAHQRINLDRVVRELNPDRRHGVERMTRVSFGVREPDGAGFQPRGIRSERAELRGQYTQLPLSLMVEFTDDGAVLECEHLTEIVGSDLARRMLDHYAELLADATATPDRELSRLNLFSTNDSEWLRTVSSGERFDAPATTLAALVSDSAARTPDATALVYEGRHYGYREVDEWANQVAHWLIAQGVGSEDRVAVLLDKSPDLVATALGVMKAGAVYHPVDPTYPQERLDYILGDSNPKLVLREPIAGLAEYPAHDPTDADRVRPLRPDNTAYLIYTSGSTGLPKGVPVAHRPIAEYLTWFIDEYQVSERDRLLQVASTGFDVSVGEIFGMLAGGARVVIPRPGGLSDVGYLTELLRDEGVTSMHFVPSLLGLFLSLPGVSQWRTLQRVPIGGEALAGELADKFHATFDALLHNFYGPTEAVLNCTRFKVEKRQGARTVPIGTPKINTQIHVLDAALQPVPIGVIGEIYIAGTHLAHGYHGRPAATADHFVADPNVAGGRMYRSGDLARRNADGDVEFIGRADEQVKIRGFRIELGEVAAAISVDPSVGQAVVVVRDLPALGRSLVAYLTPAAAVETVDVERIRARVAAALPEYMVPSAYAVIDDIPITAHGKIDRDALPEPEPAPRPAYREPAGDTEVLLAGVFSELLGRRDIGADDSFFDLGGHSLLATKLVSGVRARCGVDVGVREVLELATVAALAVRVDELRASGEPMRTPTERVLSGLFTEVLGVADVGRHDDFFVRGGTTVEAVRLAARARNAGLVLTAPMLFDHPTLAALAAAVDQNTAMATRSGHAVREVWSDAMREVPNDF